MSIENYKDPIVSQWNKYAKIVENESHVVTSGMFALTGLPDIQQRVVINGYVEIGDRDKIESSDEFKVDYTNGYVFMHSSKEGETINVAKYASRGINYYPASRVWTKLTADGDIYETLEDITNEIDGALELSREIQSEENIRIENEDIRISSEEARNISEQERILSEVTRRSNESTRENNETDRIDDENIRIQAEITRVQSELARESNEADRIELKLVLDTLKLQLENLENNITNSESVRVENENIRISNEETRVADELTRTTSEQDRVDSEVARKSDEIERSNAEQLRLEAEIIRIQDELVRVSNEDGRILLKTQLDELKTQLEELRDGLTSGNFGDMFKIMYDTNNNGKVDIAENSEKLEGKSLAEIYEDIPEGTTVEDSTTNGNIVVNGAEIQVYDDSTVEGNISDLAGEGRTTETVKDNSDKIGILSTKVSPETLLDTTSQDLSGAINEVNTKLGAHEAEEVHQSEVHGIRVNTEKKLEYFDGEEWVEVKGGGSTVPLGNIVDFTATPDDGKVALTWQDPEDIVVEGIVISQWKGTKVLRKTGSYPANENDGVLVVDSGVRNQYEINGFIDTGLTNDTKYFYMAFPYTTDGLTTIDITNRVSATPTTKKIYGVRIDTNNSNPETALTYTDMATGFTPAFCNNGNWQMGSWENKFPYDQIKPCLLKNGVVNYYLNPNDYTKKIDGSVADITSGNDGDVMIEFPKIYWKFETIGTDLYVRYSDAQIDSGYKCLAHTVGSVEKDKIYISAYKGHSMGGKLRSLSGKAPHANATIGAFRTLAQANGVGYQQFTYYSMLMLQVLALVMGKNRNTQTSLGRGYVDGNSAAINTGNTNVKGMFYGESTGKQQLKFCGIEDFYGNVRDWIDGMYSDASRNMMISNQSVFNDTGSGYINYGVGATANLGGYIGSVQGGTETGFIIKASNGSATTHYSDYGYLNGGSLPNFGGHWADGDGAGAFYFRVNLSASYSHAYYGGSLCFIGN